MQAGSLAVRPSQDLHVGFGASPGGVPGVEEQGGNAHELVDVVVGVRGEEQDGVRASQELRREAATPEPEPRPRPRTRRARSRETVN